MKDWRNPPWLRNKEDYKGIISNENKRVADYLSSHMLRTKFEYKIGKKSYDLLVEGKNILIEIDPSYTHNSTNKVLLKEKGRAQPKVRTYHYTKTKVALQNGFVCFHKFDWVSDNDLLRMIRTAHRFEFIQEMPRLHWYHIGREEHIEDFDEKLHKQEMRDLGYVEIYDDGLVFNSR